MCKTSNAGSMDLQNLLVLPVGSDSPLPLYNYIAYLAQQWNTNNNVGIVVGATHPQIMSGIRAAVPELWFLAPGIGAQGGDLEAALKAGLRKDGKGMLISVSRGISHAPNPAQAAAAIRDQIVSLIREMNTS